MIHSVEWLPRPPARRRSQSDTSLPQSAPFSRLRRSRTSSPRSPTTETSGQSSGALVGVARRTRRRDSPQPRHLRPAVAGGAPGAFIPFCLRAHSGLDGAVVGRAGRSGGGDRRRIRNPSPLGLPRQGHRPRRHAREPLEPVRKPLVPGIAVFLLAVEGSSSAVLATAAFIGAAVLGIAVAALGAVLASAGLRPRSASSRHSSPTGPWASSVVGRSAGAGRASSSFASRPRICSERRWHVLTLATYAGTLSVFLVFLVSLRAFDVPASRSRWSRPLQRGPSPACSERSRSPPAASALSSSVSPRRSSDSVARTPRVVAAVLVYRFLTMVPTIVVGLAATPFYESARGARTVCMEAA